jgi:protein involved in polysaccharide export with SLBB domain
MAGNSSVNVYMRPGDIVMLPPIAEPATTEPAGTPATAPVDPGEFYIVGSQISRGGVYALVPWNITLKQAIIAAGGADTGFVSIVRQDGTKESLVLQNASVRALNSGAIADVAIHRGDTITVTSAAQHWQGATTQQAVTP